MKTTPLLFGSVFTVSLSLCLPLRVPPVRIQPEQVHLSYPGDPKSIVVTWTTFNKTDSVVEYGLCGGKLFESVAEGSSTLFVDGGKEKRKLYIHRVTLTGLKPGFTYVYHCGSSTGWSDLFAFKAVREDTDWSPRFAAFGDMGNENPQSLGRLQKETQLGMYDAILHIGDFAYDMHEVNIYFFKSTPTEPDPAVICLSHVAAPDVLLDWQNNGTALSGMSGLRRHSQSPEKAAEEQQSCNNFSNYRNRFSMPGDTQGLWYSWNIGPAHIISFSTEVYFYLKFGQDLIFRQYEWLKRDLEEANKPENRRLRPWIITMGHRPMYCSNNDHDDCTSVLSYVRVGRLDTTPPAPGLENLFYQYGVDLELWAHEHTYERLWPVNNTKVFNGSKDQPYVNPKAPVHITTGSAGCREKHDSFIPKPKEWSAFRNSDYGYLRMQILNSTHLHLEQVSDDQDGKVIDDTWLIKDKHGAAAWL
nr:PREDICTED: iron/zinc purple acid phosphatase-like protein [Latimeria chalumnae]|eukprot:XP_014351713.1 PREDICTED: iron/zinc purple acid phosphatase-like protein [Latimeria chalumnae]